MCAEPGSETTRLCVRNVDVTANWFRNSRGYGVDGSLETQRGAADLPAQSGRSNPRNTCYCCITHCSNTTCKMFILCSRQRDVPQRCVRTHAVTCAQSPRGRIRTATGVTDGIAVARGIAGGKTETFGAMYTLLAVHP